MSAGELPDLLGDRLRRGAADELHHRAAVGLRAARPRRAARFRPPPGRRGAGRSPVGRGGGGDRVRRCCTAFGDAGFGAAFGLGLAGGRRRLEHLATLGRGGGRLPAAMARSRGTMSSGTLEEADRPVTPISLEGRRAAPCCVTPSSFASS